MSTRAICLLGCCVVLGTAGAAFGELVGHWKLDEGVGTKTVDATGKSADATFFNAPTWIDGVHGAALEFHGLGVSGGGGDYVNCGSNPILDLGGPISIALWIRPDADDPEGKATSTAPMAKAMNGMTPNWSYQVRYGWGTPTPYMGFQFYSTPTRTWVYVGRKLQRGEWCHLACSHNGKTVTCYLNGLPTQSAAMTSFTKSSTPVLIGSDGWGCDWIGAVDDVRIYNNALTADEIAALCPPSRIAKNPKPADGATDAQTRLFTWEAGYKGVLHEVYFGSTPDLGPANLVQARSTMLVYWHLGAFEPGATYYWRVDEIEVNLATVNTGDVWSFTVQALTAYLPQPKDGAGNASPAPTLTWQPGQFAKRHHVYFGSDRDAVARGAAVADKGIQTETTFTPAGPLEALTTYYWRVDEIKVDETIVPGPVWSFTTCRPVDDFESYTDKEGSRVFDAWTDGFVNGTGSVVGLYPDAVNGTFCQTTIFHGGKQSMPMDYNNVKAPFYSQTDRQFATAQNWTAGGIDMLTLYVQGKVGNRAAPLYIGLTDSSNGTALVECPNTLAITTARWTEWTIPFSDFAGVDAARIKKMSLGVGPRTSGTAGGKGTIYVDDIGLSKSHQ